MRPCKLPSSGDVVGPCPDWSSMHVIQKPHLASGHECLGPKHGWKEVWVGSILCLLLLTFSDAHCWLRQDVRLCCELNLIHSMIFIHTHKEVECVILCYIDEERVFQVLWTWSRHTVKVKWLRLKWDWEFWVMIIIRWTDQPWPSANLLSLTLKSPSTPVFKTL